jgi:cysteine desulfurase
MNKFNLQSAKKIYLDYNATTPVDPRVLKEMMPYFTEKFGNASSITHSYGWDADEAVTIAREQVAQLIGAKPGQLYFTSGATEAINLAIFGICNSNQRKGDHIITCFTEHKAVLDTCNRLEQLGYRITYLKVDQNGSIDLQELKESITDQTALITLMYANNETGVIHPLKEISEIARDRQIPLMTDATQAVGKIPFNVHSFSPDLVAFSAHKLYGPKGIGALYVRNRARLGLLPHQFGGKHESGLRAGTLNVPGIVGFGKACEICENEGEADRIRLGKLRDQLEYKLLAYEGVQVNGYQSPRLPQVSNLTLHHLDGSRLIRSLKNLAVAQGSACTSATWQPSHVLKSMGLSDDQALSSLRLSLGKYTTEEEMRIAVQSILDVKEKLNLPVA